MKPHLKRFSLLPLIGLGLLFQGCEQNKKSTSTVTPENQPVELRDSMPPSVPSATPTKRPTTPSHEYAFVSAKSGLIFRGTPKGAPLGTLHLNTQVKILEHTGVKERIKDNGKYIDGEWLGIKHQKDTVYVFSGFLHHSQTPSDFELYYASSFYNGGSHDMRTGFINVSDNYYLEEEETSKHVLAQKDLSKDTLELNTQERKRFLKHLNLRESDSVFIYNINKGYLTSIPIEDLPVIACVNIYAQGRDHSDPYDYELGFELEKTTYPHLSGFAYLGKTNPFHTDPLVPITWSSLPLETTPRKRQPDVFKDTERAQWLDQQKDIKAYHFVHGHYAYYIEEFTSEYQDRSRYLYVINTQTNSIVFSELQRNTESISLIPLTVEGSNDNGSQWTGKLFKNKAPVLYGFRGHSFGCPSFDLLDRSEPAVPIRCDNRH